MSTSTDPAAAFRRSRVQEAAFHWSAISVMRMDAFEAEVLVELFNVLLVTVHGIRIRFHGWDVKRLVARNGSFKLPTGSRLLMGSSCSGQASFMTACEYLDFSWWVSAHRTDSRRLTRPQPRWTYTPGRNLWALRGQQHALKRAPQSVAEHRSSRITRSRLMRQEHICLLGTSSD